jgi:ribosomal protein L16 Arg81 hydroxylase
MEPESAGGEEGGRMGDAKRRTLAQQSRESMVLSSPGIAGPSVLAALVAPHSVEEFLTQYWPDRVFASHGDPARLPSFLRAGELAGVESLSRVYRGTMRFTTGRKYQMMASIDQLPAMSLYRMGLTVQFEDISAVVAPTNAELRRLEAELGVNTGTARASAFASPVSEGLGVHFDSYDLFSIQLRGTKRFNVAPVTELKYPTGSQFVPGTEAFDDLYPQVGNGFPQARSAEFTCVDMQPGSVLFLPRGTWHHTECGADSLSVSVSLFMSSAADWVLRELRLLMLQDSQWRRPLYGAWGSESGRQAAESQLARLLAALPGLARQLSPEGVTRNLLPLEQRLNSIGPHDRFQRTPHTRLDVEESPSPIVDARPWISFKVWDSNYGEGTGARVQVSRAAVPVFRRIAEQAKPFSAADLAERFPDLPFTAHQQILQVAAGAGFVKLLWFAALIPDTAPDGTRPE